MGFSVEKVAEIPIIGGFVVIGEAQGVPLEERLEQLGDGRGQQAPDAEIDEILVQLRTGSKASAKLAGEPYKTHS